MLPVAFGDETPRFQYVSFSTELVYSEVVIDACREAGKVRPIEGGIVPSFDEGGMRGKSGRNSARNVLSLAWGVFGAARSAARKLTRRAPSAPATAS